MDPEEASSSKAELAFWDSGDEPTSVIDQAAREAERNPVSHNLLMGRVFGAPADQIRPCKTCCASKYIKARNLDANGANFMGWTADVYENMTDTCSAHYVNGVLKERAKAWAAMEARMAKQAEIIKQTKEAKLKKKHAKTKREEKLKAKLEKEQKAAKTVTTRRGRSTQNAKVTKPTTKKPVKQKEPESEDDDDEIDEIDMMFQTRSVQPKKAKRQQWLCPMCEKSSRFGSCGCYECGEWFHLSCVGYRSARDVPKNWICDMCNHN